MIYGLCNVLDYGATGDGVTDDTAAIQTAINAAPPNGMVLFPYPTKNYRISGVLSVAKQLTLCGSASAIVQQNGNLGVINVSANLVTLKGLVLQGQQHATMLANSKAVNVVGASAAAPIRCFEMHDCIISEFGYAAVFMQYVTGFYLNGNQINNINYAGILGESVNHGAIERNTIDTIVNAPNAYGVAITRNSAAANELVSDPISSDVLIMRNVVSNVPHWTAFDTHAGRRIRFIANEVSNCYRGIAVGDCPNKQGVSTYGPKDCHVIGNVLDSGLTDGSADAGINVNGAGTTLGTIIDGGEGCLVEANTVRGFGNQANPLGKAVLWQFSRGAVCKGNVIIEPGRSGILWYHTNFGFSCCGNTIQDPWSNAQQAKGIDCQSDYNKGVVDGNTFFRATKSATNVLQVGVNVGTYPNNKVSVGTQYCEAPLGATSP